MDTKKQKILSRIEKLLTLAKDQYGKPEGETAKRLAEELIKSHNIQADEIKHNSQQDWVMGYTDSRGPCAWVHDLACSIATCFDTKPVYHSNPYFFTFIGLYQDVDTCRYLFTKLQIFLIQVSLIGFPEKEQEEDRETFCQSAVVIIHQRLVQIKKAMEETKLKYQQKPITGKELVIIKKQLVKNYIAEFMKNKKQGKGDINRNKPRNRNAWIKGRLAGANAPINQEVSTNKRKTING